MDKIISRPLTKQGRKNYDRIFKDSKKFKKKGLSMKNYIFTKEMGEISGLGGSYEQTCRNMLKVGLEFLDNHPELDPNFHRFKNIYGMIEEDNEDAKRLSETVVKASNNDCTGAMHQAVISSILWIRKHGWDAYVKTMSKKGK